jgi:hypothetical protein
MNAMMRFAGVFLLAMGIFGAGLTTSAPVAACMPIPFGPVPRPKSAGHQQVDDIGACSRDNTSAR